MSIFRQGDFQLHSGGSSWFKIDCDALTLEDWAILARLIAQNVTFEKVIGVPTGGLKLAKALRRYCKKDAHISTLIVDDVLTTGESMERLKGTIDPKDRSIVRGIVVFSRGLCPNWIVPIFHLNLKV